MRPNEGDVDEYGIGPVPMMPFNFVARTQEKRNKKKKYTERVPLILMGDRKNENNVGNRTHTISFCLIHR